MHRWAQARTALAALRVEDPDYDTLYAVYLARMAADPASLPEDWDAVHDHVHK